MFIFYEFRPFCIDNARVIYRKIRYKGKTSNPQFQQATDFRPTP